MAEESMAERVARAMERAAHEWALPPESGRWAHDCPYGVMARAAIEAMRDIPFAAEAAGMMAAMTEAKPAIDRIRAGNSEEWAAAHLLVGNGKLYRAYWQAGIDAALSETRHEH